MPSYGFYARDQWQVTRKLTIDYGMRYEYYRRPRRDHWDGERYDPPRIWSTAAASMSGKGQLAPRLGVAYRMNEKTVIRGGFGHQHRSRFVPLPARRLSGDHLDPILRVRTRFQAAGSLRTGIPVVVGPDLNQSVVPLPLAVGTTTFPQTYDRGYVESYNFTVQRDAGAGFNLQAAYVGSRGIRQTAIVNINAAGSGRRKRRARALFPQFSRISDIKVFEPFRDSTYNALQTHGHAPHGRGLDDGRRIYVLPLHQLRR